MTNFITVLSYIFLAKKSMGKNKIPVLGILPLLGIRGEG